MCVKDDLEDTWTKIKTDLDSDRFHDMIVIFSRCLENPDILAALEKVGIKKESIQQALKYLEVHQNDVPTWIKWLEIVLKILLKIPEIFGDVF
jgi:hypothetical protein